MGVSTSISLPPNVRVQDVASVIGALLGRRVEVMLLGEGATAAHVPDVTVESTIVPEMARIVVKSHDPDARRAYNYHFETPGGRRLLSMNMTPEAIALCCALADFFGGRVDYQDCDHIDTDYAVHGKRDDENCPDDGEAWEDLQRRIVAVKPLTPQQIGVWAYDDDRTA